MIHSVILWYLTAISQKIEVYTDEEIAGDMAKHNK